MSSERFYVVKTWGFLEDRTWAGGTQFRATEHVSASVLDRETIHRCVQTFRSEDYPAGLQTKRRCASAISAAESFARELNDAA